MSPETKKFKREVYSISSEVNIYNLIDDCLINIFEYLTVEEKLKIESVCKKWEDIGKRSWSNVTSLTIDVKTMDENKCSEKLNHLIQIIKRCGRYLTSLTMINTLDIDYSVIFQELINNSQNITNIKLDDCDLSDEKNVELLFKNNQKISNVYLTNIFLNNGHVLSNLNPNLITELHLVCHFQSEPNLYDFFSKLKNLKALKINIGMSCSNNIISGLNDSNCENIHEFYLDTHSDACINELTTLLSRQKNLSKLNLLQRKKANNNLKSNFWNKIQKCPIQELSIKVDEEVSNFLPNFEILTTLKCWIEDLSNVLIIKNLAKCKNLKKISFFFVFNYNLTEEFEKSFVAFKNVESFSFTCFPIFVGGFIRALTKNNAESMKELDIINCFLGAETGLKYILLFKNLKLLKIRMSYENNKKLMFLISKLSKLERVDINIDRELNYPFFKKINDAKIKRNDKHILQINIGDRAWNDAYENYNNELDLISISKTFFLI